MAVVNRQGEIAADGREQQGKIAERLASFQSKLNITERTGNLEQQLSNALKLADKTGDLQLQADLRRFAQDAGMADLAAHYAREARVDAGEIARTNAEHGHSLDVARDNNAAFNTQTTNSQAADRADNRGTDVLTGKDGSAYLVTVTGKTVKLPIDVAAKHQTGDQSDDQVINMVESGYGAGRSLAGD
jgi:hypothetical protein